MADRNPGVLERTDDTAELLYTLAGWFCIAFGLVAALTIVAQIVTAGTGITTDEALTSTLWLVASLVLVALGVSINPRLRN